MKKMWNKCLKLYKKYEEIINYLIVGGLTTIVSLGSYYLCIYTFFFFVSWYQLQAAIIISWICAVTFAYFANRIFVFKSKNQKKFKEAVSFYGSRVATLLMDMGIMFLFVTLLHLNDKIMKLVVQVVVTVANYILSKLFVFKKK